jgi:hypothetical protein
MTALSSISNFVSGFTRMDRFEVDQQAARFAFEGGALGVGDGSPELGQLASDFFGVRVGALLLQLRTVIAAEKAIGIRGTP